MGSTAIEIMQKVLLIAAICVACACALSTTTTYYSDSACKTSLGSISNTFGACEPGVDVYLVDKKLVKVTSTIFQKWSNPNNLKCSVGSSVTFSYWGKAGCAGATDPNRPDVNVNVTATSFNTCTSRTEKSCPAGTTKDYGTACKTDVTLYRKVVCSASSASTLGPSMALAAIGAVGASFF